MDILSTPDCAIGITIFAERACVSFFTIIFLFVKVILILNFRCQVPYAIFWTIETENYLRLLIIFSPITWWKLDHITITFCIFMRTFLTFVARIRIVESIETFRTNFETLQIWSFFLPYITVPYDNFYYFNCFIYHYSVIRYLLCVRR